MSNLILESQPLLPHESIHPKVLDAPSLEAEDLNLTRENSDTSLDRDIEARILAEEDINEFAKKIHANEYSFMHDFVDKVKQTASSVLGKGDKMTPHPEKGTLDRNRLENTLLSKSRDILNQYSQSPVEYESIPEEDPVLEEPKIQKSMLERGTSELSHLADRTKEFAMQISQKLHITKEQSPLNIFNHGTPHPNKGFLDRENEKRESIFNKGKNLMDQVLHPASKDSEIIPIDEPEGQSNEGIFGKIMGFASHLDMRRPDASQMTVGLKHLEETEILDKNESSGVFDKGSQYKPIMTHDDNKMSKYEYVPISAKRSNEELVSRPKHDTHNMSGSEIIAEGDESILLN